MVSVGRRRSHLADESVLVDGPPLFTICESWRLCPHLLDVLQHHVAVAVKGLDAGEQLAIVADRDENLDMGPDGGLQDGQRPRGELVLLQLRNLVLAMGPGNTLAKDALERLRAWRREVRDRTECVRELRARLGQQLPVRSSALKKLQHLTDEDELNLGVCHVGGGCSRRTESEAVEHARRQLMYCGDGGCARKSRRHGRQRSDWLSTAGHSEASGRTFTGAVSEQLGGLQALSTKTHQPPFQ